MPQRTPSSSPISCLRSARWPLHTGEREDAVIEFKQILCPIDFSQTSIRALAYAYTLSAWYEAQLEVLHVVPEGSARLTPVLSDRLDDGRPRPVTQEEVVAEIRHAILAAGAAGVNPTVVVEVGRAHERISSRAKTQHADLLVMGSHGRSGVNRLILGSVTENTLHTAPCPVFTVPAAASSQPVEPVVLKRILCPIDFSPSALKALTYALDLGRQAGGSVTVLYALEYMDLEEPAEPSSFDPCPQAIVGSRRSRQRFIQDARTRLHAQLAGEATTWCEIEEVVVIGRAHEAILRHARESGVDVIVMGAQGAGGLALMLYGSNTQHVVRAANCPVLTVRV
jgi:nucleotide-binding universal stress UspA family protein